MSDSKMLKLLLAASALCLTACGDGSSEAQSTDACAKGFRAEDAAGRVCASTYKGLCFTSDKEACDCADCKDGDCLVAESYPTQVFCPTPPAVGGDEPTDDRSSLRL